MFDKLEQWLVQRVTWEQNHEGAPQERMAWVRLANSTLSAPAFDRLQREAEKTMRRKAQGTRNRQGFRRI